MSWFRIVASVLTACAAVGQSAYVLRFVFERGAAGPADCGILVFLAAVCWVGVERLRLLLWMKEPDAEKATPLLDLIDKVKSASQHESVRGPTAEKLAKPLLPQTRLAARTTAERRMDLLKFCMAAATAGVGGLLFSMAVVLSPFHSGTSKPAAWLLVMPTLACASWLAVETCFLYRARWQGRRSHRG